MELSINYSLSHGDCRVDFVQKTLCKHWYKQSVAYMSLRCMNPARARLPLVLGFGQMKMESTINVHVMLDRIGVGLDCGDAREQVCDLRQRTEEYERGQVA